MKYSDAMLKGFEKVGGKQSIGSTVTFRRGKPVACCAVGAVYLGGCHDLEGFNDRMANAWGRSAITLNDIDKLPWEWIYGAAVAADL